MDFLGHVKNVKINILFFTFKEFVELETVIRKKDGSEVEVNRERRKEKGG